MTDRTMQHFSQIEQFRTHPSYTRVQKKRTCKGCMHEPTRHEEVYEGIICKLMPNGCKNCEKHQVLGSKSLTHFKAWNKKK